jgi:putative oxidoreductase
MLDRVVPSLPRALAVLRVAVALLMLAHAVVRVVLGTIPQFGAFLESVGVPAGVALVWLVTIAECTSAALLLLGRYVRAGAAVLAAILIAGIPLVHVRNGWFVGEHGVGGSEYSVALLAALLVIAAADSRPVTPA